LKRIEEEKRERRLEEERRRREEQERRRREELRRRRHLKRLDKRWRRSQELGAFLSAAEAAIAEWGRSGEPAHAEWLAWARSYIDNLDPLSSSRGEWNLLTLSAPEGDDEEEEEDQPRSPHGYPPRF
jgi:hypothetical protein